MGERKYRIMLLCLGTLLCQLFFISCVLQKRIKISNCTIENKKILIHLDCKQFSQKINEAIIENEYDYLVFEKEDIFNQISKNQITVELNCANKTLKTNQEYELHLLFSGGYVTAKFFIGNPIEKIPECFPCNPEKIRIIILDESFSIGI